MSYNREDFDRIKTEYESKKRNAIADAEARMAKIHLQYPDVKAIDDQLRATGMNIMREAMKGKEGLEERIKALEENNLALQEKRKTVLKSHGLPADCTDPKYECKECSDTGYIGVKMCDCFKKALAKSAFVSSGHMPHHYQVLLQLFEKYILLYRLIF